MKNRTYKLLAPAHLVRVTFDQAEEGGSGSAAFSCVPCDDELLRWYPDHRLWLCPSCEQELHIDEADWVIKRAAFAFDRLKDDVRAKQKRSWFSRLFRSLWGRP